jgi:glycosyltransferase involved in cell wall biosynthesis
MEKPRICYVNPPILLKRPISEIIDRLSKKGYKNSLIVPKKLFKRRDESMHYSKLVESSKVYTYSIINPPFLNAEQPLPVTPIFLTSTIKAMKNNDIVHMWVPYYLTSLKIIMLKRIFFPKKPLILTMDTVPGYSFSMGKFWDKMFRIYNKMFGWLLFGTPIIVTLYGKSLIPYAVKAGIPEEKIRVISTGIDSSKFVSKDAKKNCNEIRKELKIKADTTIILFAGLLIPRKGVDKLIRMADKLRKENAVFLLAGDGPKRKEYEQMVKDLKLDDKIIFLGWRKDMARLYQASDVFILPAEGEGLPGVVMEAMAYSVPCVASNIPCIPDLIENGKSGFLCDKDDVDDFADKLRILIKNKKLASQMGKKAREDIMKRFSWDDVIEKYVQMYQSLAE